MYFVYNESGNVTEGVAAIRDAVRASAALRDEFEIRVIEDAERYADKLRDDKNLLSLFVVPAGSPNTRTTQLAFGCQLL